VKRKPHVTFVQYTISRRVFLGGFTYHPSGIGI